VRLAEERKVGRVYVFAENAECAVRSGVSNAALTISLASPAPGRGRGFLDYGGRGEDGEEV
jgi:DNA polymerase III sliding clamp (beta) subunit (PCNA family)